MQRYCTSLLTGNEYFHDDGIRILNPKQALFYIDSGVPLLDLYPSRSYQTGKKILVFVFDRKESASIYEKWKLNLCLECTHFIEDEPGQIRVVDIDTVITNMEHKIIPCRLGPVLDYKSGAPILAFYFSKWNS